jgi:hypothetical protein
MSDKIVIVGKKLFHAYIEVKLDALSYCSPARLDWSRTPQFT